MTGAALYYFREGRSPATCLATELAVDGFHVAVRQFPDGESLVRIADRPVPPIAILYRALDNPNRKLVEILLAASALRDAGAAKVLLVAPYLCYMRQDMAFRAGEAVSQKVIGALLATSFDAVVTVDPHLHRTASLDMALPGILTAAVAAAPALAEMIRRDVDPGTVIVGPDIESRPWVQALAERLGLEWIVGSKHRIADRKVALVLPARPALRGRSVIIADDVLSSGGTMQACAEQARLLGAGQVEAVVTHCLAPRSAIARLLTNSLDRIRSTDSVAGTTNAVSIAPMIAPVIAAMVEKLKRQVELPI